MASKYQKRHYEDVAKLLAYHWNKVADESPVPINSPARSIMEAVLLDFADLFATDNPLGCAECGRLLTASPKSCTVDGGHRFTWGFNRERFLKACGLEAA